MMVMAMQLQRDEFDDMFKQERENVDPETGLPKIKKPKKSDDNPDGEVSEDDKDPDADDDSDDEEDDEEEELEIM